jgi:DNA-binding MarR family transcriptional regulator
VSYDNRRSTDQVSSTVASKARFDGQPAKPSTWLVLTNHGNVLLCVARDPTIRISELADRVGIGERAAQKIIGDLVRDGYLLRVKEGRRNRYTVNRSAELRHPLFADLEIGPLLDALSEPSPPPGPDDP